MFVTNTKTPTFVKTNQPAYKQALSAPTKKSPEVPDKPLDSPELLERLILEPKTKDEQKQKLQKYMTIVKHSLGKSNQDEAVFNHCYESVNRN
jgi:hypothetical protein